LVIIRIWLCSAFRVGQQQLPVSGVPASPSANQRTLALFRPPGKAASVGPRLPPGQLFSGSKMPLSVSMLTVLRGEILYFQPPANQNRKLLYDLASFRPAPPPPPATLSSIAWKPRPTTTTRTSASPSGVASDAVVAAACQPSPVLTLATSRIQLELSRLRRDTRIVETPYHPCDASCQKSPQDASQNLEPPPHPIEKEELATS
jgi:hypothetical protein